MTFEEYAATEQTLVANLEAARGKAYDAHTAAIVAAEETRTLALQEASDAFLKGRDENTAAWDKARAAEIAEAVAKANADAGLDPDGNPVRVPPGQAKKTIIAS